MDLSYAVDIARPPAVVFPWVADPQKAMRWSKGVKGGEILHETPDRVGTTFREVLEDESGALEMTGRITEYIPERLIAFHLDSRIHEVDVRYAVEGTDGGSTLAMTTRIRWKFPMNVLSLFLGWKIKAGILRQTQSEFAELKRICEEETPAG